MNLLVQRNIRNLRPEPGHVINDTPDPDAEPRIMKAIPVHPLAKNEPTLTVKPRSTILAVKKAILLPKSRKD